MLQAGALVICNEWQSEQMGAGKSMRNFTGNLCFANTAVQLYVHNPSTANWALVAKVRMCNCDECIICWLHHRTRQSFGATDLPNTFKDGHTWLTKTFVPTLGLSAYVQVGLYPLCHLLQNCACYW